MALSRSVEVAVPADPAGDGDRDKIRLRQLGYKQELKRGLSVLSNFAFSFSIISVMAGVTTTYSTGLRYGGPVSMTLGWLVVSAFNGCMALSMAEICSAYPTSGGLYYWSAKLAGNDWAPFASWITGWFNITGQVGTFGFLGPGFSLIDGPFYWAMSTERNKFTLGPFICCPVRFSSLNHKTGYDGSPNLRNRLNSLGSI